MIHTQRHDTQIMILTFVAGGLTDQGGTWRRSLRFYGPFSNFSCDCTENEMEGGGFSERVNRGGGLVRG